MGKFEDSVARAVISAYTTLPAKSKPKPRPDATEWVPLSGIVIEFGEGELICVALGFIIEECFKLTSDSTYVSKYVLRRITEEITEDLPQPFTIDPTVKLHFYSSEAPCGDGSMELTISTQSNATPWVLPTSSTILRGRGYFSSLGTVRTKPGRADSPPTLSKSCSDKLSLRQCTSLLLSPASLLVTPTHAYLYTLTLPLDSYSPSAVSRAFGASGRMGPLSGRAWDGGYSFQPFQVGITGVEFSASKRAAEQAGKGVVGSNVSAVWVRGIGGETLIGGVLQGRKQWAGVLGASRVCRGRIWKAVGAIAGVVGGKALVEAVSRGTYEAVKSGKRMAVRNGVKAEVRVVLGGWERNGGGEFGMLE